MRGNQIVCAVVLLGTGAFGLGCVAHAQATGYAEAEAPVVFVEPPTLVDVDALQLQSSPPDPGLLNVYIDGKVIPKPGADGWDLDMTTSPPTIVLKGATCANIEAMGASSIEVQYGCPTVVPR